MVKEIAQKYENVQKGVGEVMVGALLETEARTILMQGMQQGMQQGIQQGIQQGMQQGKSQGISETKKETALKMLNRGKLTIEDIAEYSGLSVAEVEQLAGLQTV